MADIEVPIVDPSTEQVETTVLLPTEDVNGPAEEEEGNISLNNLYLVQCGIFILEFYYSSV